MKIELKNIYHSERLSEETNAFEANLYINGYKAGVASNEGHGGPTHYVPFNEKGKELIKEAETWCKTLHPIPFTAGGEEHSLDMDLELYIDDLLTRHLQQKDLQQFRNKLERKMTDHIVFGTADQSFASIKLPVDIDTYVSRAESQKLLAEIIKKHIVPGLTDDKILLNTNIPEQILKDAGLKPGQYVTPVQKSLKKPQKRKGRSI